MIRKFLKDIRGNYTIATVVAMVPIMAGVAGAVDYIGVANKAAEIQNALDTAGLAIGTRYYSGMTEAELRTYGEDHFRSHIGADERLLTEWIYAPDPLVDGSTPSYSTPPAVLTVSATLSFKGMLGYSEQWKAQRQTKVRVKPGRPACILALHPTAPAAVKIQGSTVVDLDSCVLAANSTASDAVSRSGTAQVTAECVLSGGGTYGLSPSSNVHLDCGDPLGDQYPTRDPLLKITPPAYTTCENIPGGKVKSLAPSTPGGVVTYCNKNISGEVTLASGSYILKGGQINLGGNGKLIGEKVTIFLMEGAKIGFNGNEMVQLTPPSSGPYAGITIFQEKSNANDIIINGTSGSALTGFIYAPGAHIQYAGTSNTAGQDVCIRVVGRTIEMTGTSNFKTDCEVELGGRAMFAGQQVTLVR